MIVISVEANGGHCTPRSKPLILALIGGDERDQLTAHLSEVEDVIAGADPMGRQGEIGAEACLLYTSDAADDLQPV